jgi:hypothetical protein
VKMLATKKRLLPPKTERLWYRVYGRSRPVFWLPPGPERLLAKFMVKVRRDDDASADGVVWRRVGGRDSVKLEFPYPMEITRCVMDAPYEWRALQAKNEVVMDGTGLFPARWIPPHTMTILTPHNNAMARLR